MAYSGVDWQNKPSTASPINRTNLEIMDNGIVDAHKKIDSTNEVLKDNGINNAFDGNYYNGYWTSSGQLVAAENIDICCAEKIPCPENAKVTLITNTNFTGYAIYISYFDTSGTTRIRRDIASSALYEAVAPAGTHYMTFIYEKYGINKDNFGSTALYINNRLDGFDDDIDEIHEEINAVKNGDINDNVLEIRQTKYLEIEIGNNLYDPSEKINATWYVESNNKIIEQSNQYTEAYRAVKIYLPDDISAITISSQAQYAFLRNYFTSADYNVPATKISSGIPSAYVGSGYTIQIPSGAKVVYMSMQNIDDVRVMVNAGTSAMPYEPYSKKYLLDGNPLAFEEDTTKILQMPSQFNAVVGDTLEIFFKGISNVIDSDQLEYDISASIGKAFKKKYMITPDTAGDYQIGVVAKSNNGKNIESGAFNIKVVSVPSSPSTQKNILCIGDSLTQDGIWCAEVDRRLTASGGNPAGNNLSNIEFVGTKTNGTTGYEGYGGWTINSYLSAMASDAYMLINGTFDKTDADQHSIYKDSNNKQWKLETIGETQIKIIRVSDSGTLPSSGTLIWVSGGINTDNIVYTSSQQAPGNPFWNPNTNDIDFSMYAQNLGISTIDYAVILLGWNSTGETETDYKNKFTDFITKLQSAFSDCKVVLLGLQIPSRDGLANNYGTSWKYYSTMQNVWKFNQWYADLASDLTNVYFVNVAGQFDSEHSYPTMNMTVNTRSSEIEAIQSNGIHPNTGGKYQIADAVYRKLCEIL